MNAPEFVDAIKVVAEHGAVKGVIEALENPPGKSPDPVLKRLSQWFHALSPEDRENLMAVLSLAGQQAVYNILLALDGLLAIEPAGPKGRLELFYKRGSESVLINNPQARELTGLYKDK